MATRTESELSLAICHLILESDEIARACAVGLQLWFLENNVLDPEDCYWRDDTFDEFHHAIDKPGPFVEQEARALFAAKKLCRALQREESQSGPDEATTLDCSEQCDELQRLLGIFGWGFPLATKCRQYKEAG